MTIKKGVINYAPLQLNENEPFTFRKVISQILNLFLHSVNKSTINNALSIVLNLMQADKITLRTFITSDYSDSNSYSIYREGSIDPREVHSMLSTDIHNYAKNVQWTMEILKEGKEILIEDIDNMPPGYDEFKVLMDIYKTKSTLLIPINDHNGQVNGNIRLDYITNCHQWSAVEIENLQVISDIFSNALEHKRINKEREISELKSIKNELLLDLIFERLPVGIELYDEKGALTRINQTGLEILGVREEQLLGVNIFANPIISDESKEKLRNGEETTYENNYDFKKVGDSNYFKSEYSGYKSLIGKTTPLKDSFNNVFAYLTLVYDNTEDDRRKKELEYHLTKLRMALDTGKAMIWEYDVENDKLSYDETLTGDISSWIFNNSMDTTLFTSQGQMEGIHPEDAERFYTQAVMPILEGEINRITISYRQYLGGKLEWLTSNFRSLPSPGNKKPSKVFCYTMVITEQRENELELIKIKEAARLKTLFMENISHEIRTPLNAIVGFSSIIADQNPTNENEEYKKLIYENNEMLLRLIDNMLDLSQHDTGKMEYQYKEFDLKLMGTELYNSYKEKLLPGVTLHLTYDLPFTSFFSDENKIRQIISHLLDNSLKFTEQGKITLSFRMEKKNLRIAVSDTGIGLTEEEKKQITTPFYKADSFAKGTGLGLHLAEKLVKDLGGNPGFESKKDMGSEFWFTIPLNKEL